MTDPTADRPSDPPLGAAPVGEALDRVLRSLTGAGAGPGAAGASACGAGAGGGGMLTLSSRWDEVAGPLASRCRPAGLSDDGTLVVVVEQPAFTSEVRFSGATLAAAANRVLGDERVVRVEVRTRR